MKPPYEIHGDLVHVDHFLESFILLGQLEEGATQSDRPFTASEDDDSLTESDSSKVGTQRRQW